MTIKFSINYNTQPGQTVYIYGSIPELGSGTISKAEALTYADNGNWEKEIKIVTKQERVNKYKYFVKNQDNTIIYEVGEPRHLAANSSSRKIVLNDEWQGNTPDAPFLSAPFSDIFYAHPHQMPTRTHKHLKEMIIKVTVPLVEKDASICICGNCDALGNWEPAKGIEMEPSFGSRWECHLNVDVLPQSFEYKFVKKYGESYFVWESCNNRAINVPEIADHETYSVEFSAASFSVCNPKFAGTAVPVFSLKSDKGFGIGDFSDIKLLTDWAVLTKQSFIQLLPVNDTTSTGTWTDSYPYSGISIMALHPIYLNLRDAGEIKESAEAAAFEKERKILNNMPQIDYEQVLNLKTRYLHKLFEQNSKDTFAEPAYFTFFKNNKSWLLPYAAFCTLRDKFGTADFSRWEKYAVYNESAIDKMWKAKETGKSMKYHVFVQYLLHTQLTEARNYAHSKGVAIKGDIPIGITPQSADAWVEPYYFNMNAQAGAPPDDFSAKGQNWGFPTYNWDRMAQDGYVWWKRRFSKMAEYFDAYRIDHVLGFFRIWEIPSNQVFGLMGHFNPALPYSYEEMKERGFDFKYYSHATPYIRYYMLKEMFGDQCSYVQETFLDSNELDVFTLKPEFDTQKKIESYFGRIEKTEALQGVKDGLMALVAEVLFLEDPKIQGRFHPRISAQFTYSYKALSDGEKSAFSRLYDEFFYSRHNEFWKEQAENKLPELISATNMLTCAEDLGMIPDCVPQVLKSLRVLTLEIQRMPKDPKVGIGDPAQYPYLCVCTTGTHDTSTLRGWWSEMHNEDCQVQICEKIVKEHLDSPAMLTILPLQDWFSLEPALRIDSPADERINIPSNPKHYWRFRMNVSLEHLLKMKDYNKYVSLLISTSNRNNQ